MSIAATTFYSVQCDKCGATPGGLNSTRAGALAAANLAGWAMREPESFAGPSSAVHRCPECRAEWDEQEPTPCP